MMKNGQPFGSDTLVAKNYLNEKEQGALPPEPPGNYVHRLRRADGRGSAADDNGRLASGIRPLSPGQPPSDFGGKGNVSHDDAVKRVGDIYSEFRKKQDAEYISRFDRVAEKYLQGEQP